MKNPTHRSILRGGRPLLLWLPLAAFFVFAGAAAQTTYTRQNTRVTRIQADTTFDATGAATAVKMDAFLQTRLLINDADATDVVGANQTRQVSFDLLDSALTSTNITAGGKTVTYPQLAALIRQAALDRATAAGIQ